MFLKKQKTRGFTLIEIMVALTVFSFIMVISMGAILSVLNSNRKSQSLETVMDNMNATMEDMTRTIRFGTEWHCGGGNTSLPQDCPGIPGTSITVLSSSNQRVTYALSNGRITRVVDAGAPYFVTAPGVTIQSFNFWIYGSAPYMVANGPGSCPGSNSCIQPGAVIFISGYAGAKPSVQTSFLLQTSVVQRKFDIQ